MNEQEIMDAFAACEKEYSALMAHSTFREAAADFFKKVVPVAVDILRPTVHAVAAAAGSHAGPAGGLVTFILDAAADAGLDGVESALGSDPSIVAAAKEGANK